MNKSGKNIIRTVILGLLIAIPGLTPYGIIPLGLINLTILHIPVIIAAMTEKRGVSLFYGFLFGLMSTLAAFGFSFAPQSGAVKLLLPYSALAVIAISVIPRMAVPIVTATVFDGFRKRFSENENSVKVGRLAGVSALIGSVTNTIAYLGFMWIFYSMYGIGDKFSGILRAELGIGILCEALAAALISDAVVSAVFRSEKQRRKDTLPDTPTIDIPDEPTQVSNDISSVDEISVAVIPSMESLLPALDANMQRKLDRCLKYLEDDNAFMADRAFDAWITGFTDDEDIWGAQIYSQMRFLDMSKHKSAADRLVRYLRSNVTPAMITDDHKRVYLGIMNIIHTSAALDAENPIEAARLEPKFKEAGDLITAEKFQSAADKLEEYMTEIGAKDRVIRRTEEYTPKYENTEAAQASVRELTEDDSAEGISESTVAVIPTAAGIDLPGDIDFTSALRLLSVGAEAEGAFEAVISAIPDEKNRALADAFVMLTYFERNDYVHALSAVMRALSRGYSDDLLSESDIKRASGGILTIAHSALRSQADGNVQSADRIMQKAQDFINKGMGVLAAQLLEKYILITGLAKNK